jgi:hypothetical protein
MGDGEDGSSRYRVEVLPWAEIGPGGIAFREGPELATLPWSRVLHALAAYVGEPEGVCTIVFDLVVERKETECLVCRFDADPGEPAQTTARGLLEGLGRTRCSRSLADLAAEGVPTRSYPDLDSLAEASLEELGF